MNLFRHAILGALLIGASVKAADITFSGYTSGCFGACTVTDSGGAFQQSNFNSEILNFANADFSGTTSGGTFSLNTAGNAFALNSNNLGAMDQFAIGVGASINTTFQLMVTFTAPFAQSQIFDATVTGVDGASGTATITFSGSPFLFASGGTSFDLSVNNVSEIANGPDEAITGTLTVESVGPGVSPEPSSLVLAGLGMAGLAILRKRLA